VPVFSLPGPSTYLAGLRFTFCTPLVGPGGRYCPVYTLQDRTEFGLAKTSLISSVSYGISIWQG